MTAKMKAEALRKAVEHLHGGRAALERIEHVVERHEAEPVWEGDVYVFSLKGHPAADRCYAWSEPVHGSANRRFFAVLHREPVRSAVEAVRASILRDAQETPQNGG